MADDATQKMKSLRPFDSRPSASAAGGKKGEGYLGGKVKSNRSAGGMKFGKKKGQIGVEV